MASRLRFVTAVFGWTVALLLFASAQALADDVFYSVELNDLKFTESKLPADYAQERVYRPGDWVIPYAVLDGDGEVHIRALQNGASIDYAAMSPERAGLAIRVPAERKITGALFWPNANWSGLVKLRFAIEQPPSDKAKAEFIQAKESHYAELLSRGAAGAAWFRHQLRELRGAGGRLDDQVNPPSGPTNRNRVDTLDQTFELLSGGRAISENLQLDRVLPRAAKGEDLVSLDSLKGISVAAIDWKPLIKDIKPDPDPLALLVPADQHSVLFPSVSALAQVADRFAQQGTIILQLAQPVTSDSGIVARYQRQLGLSLEELGQIAASQAIGGVALTGSDPFFASGTDVALVFETAQPDALKDKLWDKISSNADAQAKKSDGKIGTLSYRGVRSDDRTISSYVAALGGAVVVTNSPYPLQRFADVASGKTPALGSLDDFTFFRHRYPRGDKEESALMFLSDETIRRWCGPRWRIAASRETRDAAVLSELQAMYMDKLVKRQVAAGPLHTDWALSTGGELTLSPEGVQSSELGSLDFMTPIAELKFDKVTRAEAEAYERWRDGYQQNWRWAFDPIALRLGVDQRGLSADLTVMPLIAANDYRDFITISKGAAIAPDAGDRHDAIVQLILAINLNSDQIRGGANLLSQLSPGSKIDPLSWLGESVSLYVDDDPFWQDFAACKAEERETFLQRNFGRIPVALWAEVSSGLKLTVFLAGARAAIEQTAPGMTTWEALDYHGQPYVKIAPTERALPPDADGQTPEGQFYYVATGSFFLLTPNEAVLKRAIDRQTALTAAEARTAKNGAAKKVAPADPPGNGQSAAPADQTASTSPRPPAPWLGTSLALQVDHRLLESLTRFDDGFVRPVMRSQSWNNLPILNEWHRLYPNEDPLAVHERNWHERLVCPGGGKYVWNADWQTMESTVYGHPGEPKAGPGLPPALSNFRFANFGLTFENQGLRGRLTLDREPDASAKQAAAPSGH